MSSSFRLAKRRQSGIDVDGLDDGLGGWSNHYVTSGGCHECHPDYYAIPFRHPHGIRMCVKRKGNKGHYLDRPQTLVQPGEHNGYNKYQADLYSIGQRTATQLYNPDYYHNRRIPHEEQHLHDDLLRLEVRFNGTGIEPIHTPGDQYFNEYGVSAMSRPPYRYDVTRLHQTYPIWRREKMCQGLPRSEVEAIDREHVDRLV